MTQQPNSPSFSVKILDQNGKVILGAKRLTEEQAKILQILLMKPNEQTIFSTQPYDKATSFLLVDEGGNTLFRTFRTKYGTLKQVEERRPLRINSEMWRKYKEWCNKMGYSKPTLCAPIREFHLAFTKLNNGQEPKQETLRYFVELLIKTPIQKPLRFGFTTEEQQTATTQKSMITDKEIKLYPVIRKTPSYKT